ncbi:hypothetical protein HMN09_00557100 [Mycena chlorophos]|uniref:Uncharacterized protein n=2 Tax=Mycena chlorophos TaxID=658473 RepID=A0A146ILJ9_MYCCL|nr:hypothetical protein HMN09_00557100 [Mycena chlorophos]GAT60417.1 predicted protein [Mycena chlorophos]
MPFAFLPFPYLHNFTLLNQFLILVSLCIIAYVYRPIRLALLGILGSYAVYVVGKVLIRWGFVAFKGIAWMGFYLYFFLIGVGYILTAATTLWNLPEMLSGLVEGMENK